VGDAVSVVIPSVDRAAALERLLHALTLQTHPDVEVVVVLGPTVDDSEARLERVGLPVKLERCPVRNLSIARNIGIAAAGGDVVAFIDDDAVPEPVWLAELVAALDSDDETAVVGGLVFDDLGTRLQYEAMTATRLGEVREVRGWQPGPIRCFPGSWEFPYAPGGNAAYRREVLAAIGGFDEVYDYYLDETDVCLRLVDAGWVVRTAVGGPIHHKHMSSGVRNRQRVVTNWRSIVRNRAYFAARHATDDVGSEVVLSESAAFRDRCLATSRDDHAAGRMDDDELAAAIAGVATSIDEGVALARTGPQLRAFDGPTDVVPFPTSPGPHRLVVHLGPGSSAGLEAPSPATELHVLEPAPVAASTVELDGAVWWHRVAVGGDGDTALEAELARLRSYRRVDDVIVGTTTR
jgi:glycogen(starch) synthase